MLRFIRLRTKLTLLVVACFIILNDGFMQVRLPPVGPGAPIGEVLIALFLGTILLDLKFAGKFASAMPIGVIGVWWAVGLGHLLLEVPRFGFWAFRDAAHLLESIFIWIGFVVASRPGFLAMFEKWLKVTFGIAALYIFTYPLRDSLQAFSPRIPSISGQSEPVFFNYANINSSVFTAFFREIISPIKKFSNLLKFIVVVLSAVIIVVFLQQRTAYIQIVALMSLVALVRPQGLGKIGIAGILGILLISLILIMPFKLTGRLGGAFSFEFLISHVQAIWGGGGADVRGASEGVSLRFHWWQNVFRSVNSNGLTAILGLGFGLPLTNFHGPDGNVVREVHSSIVSVYGRLGLTGLICFLTIQAVIFSRATKLIIFLKRKKDLRSLFLVSSIVCYLLMCLVFALGEGAFEASYVAVSYYFLAGVLLAVDQVLRNSVEKTD